MSFIRRINVKPMIVAPQGSILPTNLGVPIISEGTFLEKIVANNSHDVAIALLTVEELIALVEKPHLFGIDVVALVGVPGGRYDAVWSSYVAPLRRVSLDTLPAELKKIQAQVAQLTEPPPPLPRQEQLGYRGRTLKNYGDPDEYNRTGEPSAEEGLAE